MARCRQQHFEPACTPQPMLSSYLACRKLCEETKNNLQMPDETNHHKGVRSGSHKGGSRTQSRKVMNAFKRANYISCHICSVVHTTIFDGTYINNSNSTYLFGNPTIVYTHTLLFPTKKSSSRQLFSSSDRKNYARKLLWKWMIHKTVHGNSGASKKKCEIR